jgi:hypothetical protein
VAQPGRQGRGAHHLPNTAGSPAFLVCFLLHLETRTTARHALGQLTARRLIWSSRGLEVPWATSTRRARWSDSARSWRMPVAASVEQPALDCQSKLLLDRAAREDAACELLGLRISSPCQPWTDPNRQPTGYDAHHVATRRSWPLDLLRPAPALVCSAAVGWTGPLQQGRGRQTPTIANHGIRHRHRGDVLPGRGDAGPLRDGRPNGHGRVMHGVCLATRFADRRVAEPGAEMAGRALFPDFARRCAGQAGQGVSAAKR